MDNELLEALKFAFETSGESMGPYHASTHMTAYDQSEEWNCHGCKATSESYWRDSWRLTFKHEEECRYVALLRLLGRDPDRELARIAGEDRTNGLGWDLQPPLDAEFILDDTLDAEVIDA